jgi:hypothetical protein
VEAYRTHPSLAFHSQIELKIPHIYRMNFFELSLASHALPLTKLDTLGADA